MGQPLPPTEYGSAFPILALHPLVGHSDLAAILAVAEGVLLVSALMPGASPGKISRWPTASREIPTKLPHPHGL